MTPRRCRRDTKAWRSRPRMAERTERPSSASTPAVLACISPESRSSAPGSYAALRSNSAPTTGRPPPRCRPQIDAPDPQHDRGDNDRSKTAHRGRAPTVRRIPSPRRDQCDYLGAVEERNADGAFLPAALCRLAQIQHNNIDLRVTIRSMPPTEPDLASRRLVPTTADSGTSNHRRGWKC